MYIKNIKLSNKEIYEVDNNDEENNNHWLLPIIIVLCLIVLCLIAFCIYNSSSLEEDLSVKEFYQNYQEPITETIVVPQRAKIENYNSEPL